MTIETARRASLEFVCVFGHDVIVPFRRLENEKCHGRPVGLRVGCPRHPPSDRG